MFSRYLIVNFIDIDIQTHDSKGLMHMVNGAYSVDMENAKVNTIPRV